MTTWPWTAPPAARPATPTPATVRVGAWVGACYVGVLRLGASRVGRCACLPLYLLGALSAGIVNCTPLRESVVDCSQSRCSGF